MSITGRSPSLPFCLPSLFCLLQFSPRFSLSPCGIVFSVIHFYLFFHKFLSVLNISFPKDHLCSFSCTSYNINKSHKLPLAQSSITSSTPLDIIFSDVWTSPISSSHGFHYYIIFVDHYTKYIWLYLLRKKSDVLSTFVAFNQLIENYFATTIKTLYTDNGAEFLALRSFHATPGITHLTIAPHTPKHNGYSKSRHRHIVKTGLSPTSSIHPSHLLAICLCYDCLFNK